MSAPGASGITPKPTPRATPGPSRAASIKSDDSEPTTVADTDRFVVKSLDMQVSEGGKNFSAGAHFCCFSSGRYQIHSNSCLAGQRQLLALARGILKLKSSSILILDESTASLDSSTDEQIQRTIREEMADATILCIARKFPTSLLSLVPKPMS